MVTIDPARRLAAALGLRGALRRAAAGSTRARSPRRASSCEGELWAMMLDAKRTFDEIVARLAPDERRARGDPRQPHLPRALDGGRRLAGAQRDRQALRAPRGARLRRDRARHAAVAQRARLPRRARRGCSASSKAARCRCSSRPAGSRRALFGRGTGARVRDLRARHRRRHARRAVDASSARSSGVIDGFGERTRGVAALLRDAADGVPDRHLARARAGARGACSSPSGCAEAGMSRGGLIVNRVHLDGLGGHSRRGGRGAARAASWASRSPRAWPRTSPTSTCSSRRDRETIARLSQAARRARPDRSSRT